AGAPVGVKDGLPEGAWPAVPVGGHKERRQGDNDGSPTGDLRNEGESPQVARRPNRVFQLTRCGIDNAQYSGSPRTATDTNCVQSPSRRVKGNGRIARAWTASAFSFKIPLPQFEIDYRPPQGTAWVVG